MPSRSSWKKFMKLANEEKAGFSVPPPPALEAVIGRLAQLSLKPEFFGQRELALGRALKPYIEGEAGRLLAPLPQEADLALLLLYCDFYPEDGHLTLIEQLRDVITEHIANEERVWLDPLKHSSLDLLEITARPKTGERLALRSIGDRTTFMLPAEEFANEWTVGQVLLTRVIRDPDAYDSGKAVWAGPVIVLSSADAQALLDQTGEWRREMEMSSGSFALGEWQEFTKRFGHMVLWAFAQLRMSALVDAVTHIQYRTVEGQPYLYAVALYDHHEYRFFSEGLSAMKGLTPDPAVAVSSASQQPVRRWLQPEMIAGSVQTVARLTLTSAQLIVECDAPERLDAIKHQLAAAFGFSLHFRGETLSPPALRVTFDQLVSDQPVTIVITGDEDRALLKAFLDNAYLEWSDRAHLQLGGQTPRHAAASPTTRDRVAALLDEMAQNDPGLLRTGQSAFDYNILRGHVGLDEVPR
jgi:hypothetical protein